MAKRDATAGERLCSYIRREILQGDLWPEVITTLTPVARAFEWARFFEEVAAVHLTGRIVAGGKSISLALGPTELLETDDFEQSFRDFLQETTQLTGRRRREMENKLMALGKVSVRAARSTISASTDSDLIYYARTAHKRCYLCGTLLLFARAEELRSLDLEDQKRAFEAEHIWPQSYGGDSDVENLLPACVSCNRAKDNYPCWASVDIQSLILGLDPADVDLRRISGLHRFSMMSRAAYELAEKTNLTLKGAFLELGHGVTPYVGNTYDVADYFNLRNTRP